MHLAGQESLGVTSVEVLQETFNSYLVSGRPDIARQVTLKFMAIVPDVIHVVKDDILNVVELSREYPHLPC